MKYSSSFSGTTTLLDKCKTACDKCPTEYRNTPGDLFKRIKIESEESCIYRRLYLDYRYVLDKIYTREELVGAKISPSFGLEYNLKFVGLVGNVR